MKFRLGPWEDALPGGAGDDMPLSKFDPDEVALGLPDEKEEHGAMAAPEVVADHLAKDPHYYTKRESVDVLVERLLSDGVPRAFEVVATAPGQSWHSGRTVGGGSELSTAQKVASDLARREAKWGGTSTYTVIHTNSRTLPGNHVAGGCGSCR